MIMSPLVPDSTNLILTMSTVLIITIIVCDLIVKSTINASTPEPPSKTNEVENDFAQENRGKYLRNRKDRN